MSLGPFTCKECGKSVPEVYYHKNLYGGCKECVDAVRDLNPLGSSYAPQWDDKSLVLVYENPKTGQVSYPGRNDREMPAKYAAAGFQEKRMRHLHEVNRFEKERGVINHAMNYNKGNLEPCDDR